MEKSLVKWIPWSTLVWVMMAPSKSMNKHWLVNGSCGILSQKVLKKSICKMRTCSNKLGQYFGGQISCHQVWLHTFVIRIKESGECLKTHAITRRYHFMLRRDLKYNLRSQKEYMYYTMCRKELIFRQKTLFIKTIEWYYHRQMKNIIHQYLNNNLITVHIENYQFPEVTINK